MIGFISACAHAPAERCFAEDEGVARQIALAATAPQHGALLIRDAGDHWELASAPTHLEGELIVSLPGGFSFDMDKCSGAMSNYRVWR